MRKFAVLTLLLGGLLLSATTFAATQQTQHAATASTTRHEMAEAKAKDNVESHDMQEARVQQCGHA